MKIIYYYHIPKCGGTLISSQLRELSVSLKGEYHNFNFPMDKFGLPNKVFNNCRLRLFLNGLNDKTTEYKFVHHHHGFYGVSEIFDLLQKEKSKAQAAGNEFYLFTCIREPVSFQLSRINYLRNSCDMPDVTFEDACTDPDFQNVMFKYFLSNHPRRWKDLNTDKNFFMKNLALMDKVFILENLADLYDWLQEILGVTVRSPEKKARVGTHSLKPTDRQLEMIRQVNGLDQFFYDTACNKAVRNAS